MTQPYRDPPPDRAKARAALVERVAFVLRGLAMETGARRLTRASSLVMGEAVVEELDEYLAVREYLR